METQVFSVTQITEILKELIETSFSALTVEGEISNYRPSSTGHIYFTLKDETSAIQAVLFKGKARTLPFGTHWSAQRAKICSLKGRAL